tara:strand:+ start:3807 stop:4919 length:1113 start_codon:yes stop_codon:yes gene_type:complete
VGIDSTSVQMHWQGKVIRTAVIIVAVLMTITASAHHSISALYDYTNVVKLKGTITSIRWINPHVQLKIKTINNNGDQEIWQLEASAVNLLRRIGLNRDAIKEGVIVVATGPTSRRGLKTMVASTIALENGDTYALFPGSAARAGLISSLPTVDGSTQRTKAEIEQDKKAAHGVFRVWSPRKVPGTDQGLGVAPWPLTESALMVAAKYNPLVDDPALRCVPAGMPNLMDNPYPMRFYEEDGNIVMHFELNDTIRVIHMNDNRNEANNDPSPLGYSTGRWEGGELVVETNKINYPYFDDLGTPQSGNLKLFEHYRLSENDTRLDWEIVAVDPEIFTESVLLAGYMAWVPGEEVKPFNCTVPDGFSWQLEKGK